MMLAGSVALAGVAVVDLARSACRQSKGSGPRLVPHASLQSEPPPPPRPAPASSLLVHHPGCAVPQAFSPGCLRTSEAASAGVVWVWEFGRAVSVGVGRVEVWVLRSVVLFPQKSGFLPV